MSPAYDWRSLMETADAKPADALRREVRRRYAQGQQPPDLALAFRLDACEVRQMLFGDDDTEADRHRVFPNYKKGGHR